MNKEIYFTKGIQVECEKNQKFFIDILKYVKKFSQCDWGDTCEDDCKLNQKALKTKDRIVALYNTNKGKVFIIKEAEDGITTVLFGSEY